MPHPVLLSDKGPGAAGQGSPWVPSSWPHSGTLLEGPGLSSAGRVFSGALWNLLGDKGVNLGSWFPLPHPPMHGAPGAAALSHLPVWNVFPPWLISPPSFF